MLSKTLFRLIDGLILCANKLCGIESIKLNGEDSDFLTYLFFSEEVSFAFKVSALLATILVFIFTVFMIIRSITKDKAEGTPGQIAIRSLKTLLMFFFVPAVMVAFMTVGNACIRALYSATMQTAATPGAFLFGMFARDGGMTADNAIMFESGEWDYTNTELVSVKMVLSNFPFLFSWIAGGVVLFGIGSAMLIFVDRVLSLVLLYIASPISISTSIVDEGARFKLWRDQFLSKFIMGYGMIIAINIYALVCSLVMSPDVVFFEETSPQVAFLNMIMKLLIIAGGALTMNKSMALIGNIVSSGAGSNELRDSMTAGRLASAVAGAGKTAGKLALGAAGIAATPLKPVKSIISDAASLWSRDKASRLLGYGGEKSSKEKDKEDGDSGSRNDGKAEYGSNNTAKNALEDPKFKVSDWAKPTGTNTNNNQPTSNKNTSVTNAINNGKPRETKNQEPPREENGNQ